MPVELSQIDLSPIGELVRIRKEEEILEERLAKMEAKNEQVSPLVYARVKSDYEARRDELARGARPLREKALAEYQRLKVLRAEVERAVQQVSLEKEELEFRRDLGEFPDEEFTKRIAECEKRLAGEKRQLEDVLQIRSRFAAAFRSEEELESGTPGPPPAAPAHAAPPMPVPVPPAPRPPAAVPASPAAARPPMAPPHPPPVAHAVNDGVTPDGTVITAVRPPVPGSRTPSTPGAPAVEAAPPPPHHSATAVLPRARLTLLEGDAPAKEFPLKPGVSVIGRLAQSDVQLPSPDVSRRHAQITVGPDGCYVADLGSENGVAVNGKLVETHRLADGDVLVLGKQRLVFHE
jgi:hypothetical protein